MKRKVKALKYEGFNVEEIAFILDITESAVMEILGKECE